MWFPKGVAVIANPEGESYDYFEFMYALENLANNMFTGLLIVRLSQLDETYYLLMKEGIIVTYYLVTGEEDVNLEIVSPTIFKIRAEGAPVKLNYYVLTPGVVDILMLAFTFNELTKNHPISSTSDFDAMLSQFYSRKITGIIKCSHSDAGLLLFQGSLYYDFLVDDLIDILCSPTAVKAFKEKIKERGSVFLTVWGEEHQKAQEKLMQQQNRFAKFKTVTLKVERGFLDNTVKVAPEVYADWVGEGYEIVGLRFYLPDKPHPVGVPIGHNQLRKKDIDVETMYLPKYLFRRANLEPEQIVAVEPIYKHELEAT